MLTDHGRCCFVVLFGYQLLTDGICDDVLDMVEGIAGETVIKLMQEEKGINSLSAMSQCPMDPMVMGSQRTEKSEELRLFYYLRIHGNTPPQSTVY
jgi:hypothetical protein